MNVYCSCGFMFSKVSISHVYMQRTFANRCYDGSAERRCRADSSHVLLFTALVKNLPFDSLSLPSGMAIGAS